MHLRHAGLEWSIWGIFRLRRRQKYLVEHEDTVVREERIAQHLPDQDALRDELDLGELSGEILVKPEVDYKT